MAKMNKEDLLFYLQKAYNDSYEYTSPLDARHQTAYDMYQARLPKKVNENDPHEPSATPVLRTAVNNILPQLVAIFSTDEKSAVRVRAIEGQVPQNIADALTMAINSVVLSDNQIRKFFTDLFTEILVFGTAFTKTYKETKVKQEFRKEFTDMPETALALMIEQLRAVGYLEQDITLKEDSQSTRKLSKKEREDIANSEGIPLEMVPKKLVTVSGSIHAILRTENIKVQRLPYYECYMGSRHMGSVADAPYFCHEQTMHKDELIALGFDRESVEAATGITNRVPQAFNAMRTTMVNQNDYYEYANDESYACIQENYWRGNYDGNEDALWKITTCKDASIIMKKNGKLDIERIDYIPIQEGKCMVMPDEFWGQSLYDLLAEYQNQKTQVKRAMIQGAALNSAGRYTFLKGAVNRRDMVSMGRPGALVEISQPGALQPIEHSQIDNTLPMLDQQLDEEIKMIVNGAYGANNITEEMTNMSGAAIQLLQNQDKTTAVCMAHVIAETLFKPLYKAILLQLQELGKPLVVEGKAFDMKMLPADLDFIVDIDTAEDDANAAQNVLNLLSVAIQQNGGIPKFFTEENCYNIYEDYLKQGTFKGDVSKYITAPEDLPPPTSLEKVMEAVQFKSAIYHDQMAEAHVFEKTAEIESKLASAAKEYVDVQKVQQDIENSKVELVLKNKQLELDEFNALVNARLNGIELEQSALKTASDINVAQWNMTNQLADNMPTEELAQAS
ncbi:hypothetical protein QEF67_003195 [Klebsiella aerogenes]|uniref:portal protein n=1 Tax=Klebsiella aerogenes TaxID=548 RepID=UPI002A252D00|nr:hypothetical protein [Klebsiella aerogenes]